MNAESLVADCGIDEVAAFAVDEPFLTQTVPVCDHSSEFEASRMALPMSSMVMSG